MTKTLDAILKTKLLTNSSIPASRAFSAAVARLLPAHATIGDAIQTANTIYLQTTGCASVLSAYAFQNTQLPSELYGFHDPYARQSVSDFSYLIREVIREHPEAAVQYAAFRPHAQLHDVFLTYLPVPSAPTQKSPQLAAA